MEAFFERVGRDRFRATALTRGPWSPDHQHAGPPAALLGEGLATLVDGQLSRITIEILRPVAITELVRAVEVARPGRSVSMVAGTLSDDRGPVLLGRAWVLRIRDEPLPADAVSVPDGGIPGPDEARPQPFFATGQDAGYHTAMEVRFVRGGFTVPGPALAWFRPRCAIVAGEEVTPLQRVLVAADSGNGISAFLDPRSWVFVNTDLTVHLHRPPRGEWVALDASTTAEPTGIGLATSRLHDRDGPIGHALQTLLVDHRPS